MHELREVRPARVAVETINLPEILPGAQNKNQRTPEISDVGTGQRLVLEIVPPGTAAYQQDELVMETPEVF